MTNPIVQSITDEQLADIEEYTKQPGFECKDAAQMSIGELRALITRLREAEADARRYRFIRNYDDGDEVERALINPKYTPIQIRMGVGLDKAIDAAMERQP